MGNVHQNTNNIVLCVSNCRVHAASSRPVETDRVANYLYLEALLVIHWGVSFCTLGSERGYLDEKRIDVFWQLMR